MSIAELHGKISSSGTNLSDRLEDLLTADIFGPLRYLPFQDGLSHILIQAMNYHDHSFFSVVPGIRDIAPTFRFWPKLRGPQAPINWAESISTCWTMRVISGNGL